MGPFAWILALALAANAYGQTPSVTLAEPVPAPDDLAVVLEQGARLEQERRWAEALSHYEQALRAHPERADLQHRVALTRAHYDVCRRYNDQSYLASLGTLGDRDALAIYDEILQKLQAHYVQEPQWQRIVYCGMTSMEVAVTEALFVKRNLPSATLEQLTALQRETRQLVTARPVADRQQALELIQQVAYALRDRYGLAAQTVILEFTSGAAAALDEYSGFLTGGQMDEVFSQIEGNFVGLGVELKTEPAGLLIVNVISGGPADEGGIKPGDRLVEVEGKTTGDCSPDSLADMLRGVEGSQVTVVARGADNATRRIQMVRRRVEVPSVDQVKMIDSEYGVGYFKLQSFQKTTSRDVDAALWKLHEQGMKHLIIDLRGNPGGLLKAAVDVADKFVYEGLIVATRGRSSREDFDHRGAQAGTWRIPLVILIDHDSASASEILAGAIRDHRRGTIVGEKSYGKGSVQGIFPLTAGNVGVRLTTAKWYTPSGKAIQGAGVAPDVVVAQAKQHVTAKATDNGQVLAPKQADAILDAGLQIARTQVSSRRTTP
jgi:carboxyl-terminal processing protease